jgi:hypothetical protein
MAVRMSASHNNRALFPRIVLFCLCHSFLLEAEETSRPIATFRTPPATNIRCADERIYIFIYYIYIA